MSDRAELQTALERHLAWWGLRHLALDEQYDEWQRQALTAGQRAHLTELIEAKRRSRSVADDIAFYDASADPAILPVLYSQRYPLYLAVGPAMAERLEPAQRTLDLGCGPGILTTFFATRFPGRRFLGVDRSRACIETARRHAASLSLANVEFACGDVATWEPEHRADLVLTAQALFQAEQDPGIPSRSWRTFTRAHDPESQRAFELRTGLGGRLDRVPELLTRHGRLFLFEKTGHLARRVPFQRALAARGFGLLEPPTPLPCALGEEAVEADLLYVLGKGQAPCPWPEAPAISFRDAVSLRQGPAATEAWTRLPRKRIGGGGPSIEVGLAAESLAYLYRRGEASRALLVVAGAEARERLDSLAHRLAQTGADHEAVLADALGPAVTRPAEEDPAQAPLYENHTAAAQAVWEALPRRVVEDQADASEPDGRQLHLELGTSEHLVYLYCANTFDQRQLVVMDPPRRALLAAYYAELVEANRAALDAGR